MIESKGRHTCDSGAPRIDHRPEHLAQWGRIPDAMRVELVDAVVRSDEAAEGRGWPSPGAEIDRREVRSIAARIATILGMHECPSWVVAVAITMANDTRGGCLWCALRRRGEQRQLPGVTVIGVTAAAAASRSRIEPARADHRATRQPDQTPPGILPTSVALAQLRSGLKIQRKQ